MSENTQNLLILLAVGIPTAYIYLRRRQNRIRQEMLEQRQRSKLQSSQSGDADSIPEEAEVILGELTELRLKQAETLAQIEDIQNGSERGSQCLQRIWSINHLISREHFTGFTGRGQNALSANPKEKALNLLKS